MVEFIDKTALVAEIEKWLGETDKGFPNDHNLGRYDMCKQMLSFINSIEAKEVDFDAEWKKYFEYRGDVATVNIKHLAKHFFELGIQKSNSISNEKD